MNTNKSKKLNALDVQSPEPHLLILWHNGLSFNEVVEKEIDKRGFQGLVKQKGSWPNGYFSRNLSKFYGRKIENIKRKTDEVGEGDFIVFTFWDDAPVYELRETSRGFETVNRAVFDLKAALRSLTKSNCVHGTNSMAETRHDFRLLFGKSILEQKRFEENHISPLEILPGVDGWKTLGEAFSVLNDCDNYVVLRNFEGLPDEVDFTEHGDIDFLSVSWIFTRDLLGAKPLRKAVNSRHYEISMASGKTVKIDLRSLGDNYYDLAWQKKILMDRVQQNGVYVPDPENHKYSLIYHALIHKWYVSSDYSIVNNLSESAGMSVTWDDNLKKLTSFMYDKRYSFLRAMDTSVGYDPRYTPSGLSEQIDKIEEIGLCDVQPFKVEAWKNRFNSSYFIA
ncbi:hypothetical protein RB2150_12021 [Rhodobacteraceae bacterium HTCC2150]|nr:hypothetical protein RB2150_12021 [Rhodobacteraceae bacterium HTCC2150]